MKFDMSRNSDCESVYTIATLTFFLKSLIKHFVFRFILRNINLTLKNQVLKYKIPL